MGCASSTEKAAVVAPPSLPRTENSQPPAVSKPVSEAASGHLGKPVGPTHLPNSQTSASTFVMADAVVSFTTSESGRPDAKTLAPIQKEPFDADLAEVDRLLELPTHELEHTFALKAQPLSLHFVDDAPPTPPLPSRAPGVSYEQSASSSSSTKPVGTLPPIAGKPVSAVMVASTDSMLSHLMEEDEPDEDDPWSSLQSKYKLGRPNAGARTSALKGKTTSCDIDEDDVVILDSDNSSSKNRGFAPPSAVKLAARPLLPPQPLVPGGPVRTGGWGNGDLAAAGTLMLGEEPPTYSSATAAPLPGYTDHNSMWLQPAAVRQGEDLGMEDMDDVDALLAEEMVASGLNSDFASKLARFEALNDEED
jgi:hypothetical protein